MKQKIRILSVMLLDIILISASYYFSLLLRFEGKIAPQYIEIYKNHAIIITLIKLITFQVCKLYKSLWKYASISELMQVVVASIISNTIVLSYMFIMHQTLPRSVYIIAGILDVMLIGGIRFSYRVVRRLKNTELILKKSDQKRVMIIGTGDAGAMLIKEFRYNAKSNSEIVVLIDDDPGKKNKIINGVQVKGQTQDILKLAQSEKIDEIIIAIPSASKEQIRRILNECEKTNCKLKILPGIYDMINGKIDIKKVREIQIEDLLGRDEIKLDVHEVSDYIKDKRVLVTGGGGSIGSELCRQIAQFKPSELIILDIYENNAYDLQNELLKQYKDEFQLKVIIASVRDKIRIEEIMGDIKPHVIFHAAAHKHVPLMESNPKAAVKNNIFGTLNVVEAAHKYKVNRFVLISTDKAVNPTNVMGATKRACELIIQSYNTISETEFVAVRFGNVLGSNGSVIPLFKKQIAEGGPVTVTHKNIIRYFMTIPEAARLVIQAGSMARGGELFILDMGEPVKIIDLAKKLIRLHGFEPEKDIHIEITGLRPGEKLYEELFIDKKIINETAHEKIFVESPISIDYNQFMIKLSHLEKAIHGGNEEVLMDYLQKIVPTYKRGNTPMAIHDENTKEEIIVTEEVAITKERVI